MSHEKLLADLRSLLTGWGIAPDDWYVTGEMAMELSGYPITMRPGQMDVLVCRDRWPWPRPEDQVSLFPDAGTEAEEQLNVLVNRFNTHFDFHPLPHVGLTAEDRFVHSRWHPDERGVRVLEPWAGILHRKIIIEFYERQSNVGLQAFDRAKFERWRKFVEEVENHARKIGDQKVVETAALTYPAVDRAIAFFDGPTKLQIGTNIQMETMRGIGAAAGIVEGTVRLYDGDVDATGYILVMEHALPMHTDVLRSASGVIVEQGGLLSHAATIAREFGIPAVIGFPNARTVLKNGMSVSLDGTSGTVTVL